MPEPMKAVSALTHANALICTSSEISSPLTLGWLAPVVLLQELALPEEALCGVICGEFVHVARHDWMTAPAGRPKPSHGETVTVPNRWESFGTREGKHYRHQLTGVEFDVPDGWSLGTDVRNDASPISMTMLNDPEARTGRAGVQMLPVETPAADIPAALDHAIPQLIARRARNGILHFSIRQGSEEHTWIDGNQALRAVAEKRFPRAKAGRTADLDL